MITYNDYWLSHHGVPGQKWGVRNAEWYPIADYKAHLERSGKKTVFVSGSSKTQFEDSPYYRKDLPSYVRASLDGHMKNGSKIVVGDAPGIDRQVQDYLNKAKYKNVDVYSPGKEVRYIANPKWNSKLIDDPDHEPYSSEWLAKKDIEMSKVADEGLAVILDEGSNATRNNIRRLEEMGKNVAVYELSKDGPSLDRIVKNYKEVLDMELKHCLSEDFKYVLDIELKDYSFENEEYLSHHGVPGQKWGERNAEWYPISAWKAHLEKMSKERNKTSKGESKDSKGGGAVRNKFVSLKNYISGKAKEREEKKEKERKAQARANALKKASETRAQKKVAEEEAKKKAAAEAAEEERKKKEAEAAENEKQRVLKSGTIEEILKYTGKVDNAVLKKALEDRRLLNEEISKTPAPLKTWQKALNSTANIAIAAAKISKDEDVAKAANAIKGFNKVLSEIGLMPKEAAPSISTLFSSGNALNSAAEIVRRMKEGSIQLKDVENVNKAWNNLKNYENYIKANGKSVK